MGNTIQTAVIPAAGLGTRNFISPEIPKEILPIFDRPIIQQVVDEAREAGITTFVFVISKGKEMVPGHFMPHRELEQTLEARNKKEILGRLRDSQLDSSQIRIAYQHEALGLGHAVLQAKGLVGNQPFALLLPDEIMLGKPSCLQQMVDIYRFQGGNIIASQEVPREQTKSYGILKTHKENGVMWIDGMVEKPSPPDAPSNSAIIGRYILNPEIFGKLEKTAPGAGGEIQLTDGMVALLKEQPFYELPFKGDRHDCGNYVGLFKCAATLALQSPQHGDTVYQMLREQLEADFRSPQKLHDLRA